METLSAVPSTPVPLPARARIRHYPHEEPLFMLLALFALSTILLGTLLTLGLIWLFIGWLYLMYLAVGSYLITYLRGNAIKVTAEQFPDLYARFCACCAITGVKKLPDFYLLAGDGIRNAFATRFLNRYYVVLLTDIVDALDEDEEGLNFYIGHELGHVAQKHIARMWWLRVAMGTPLLGAAYSRAREYTCDQYGLACCATKKSAIHALSVLAAGSRRWKTMNTSAFIAQSKESNGFWMTLNELTGDYPWLCKRVARIEDEKVVFPRRHAFAWFLAMFVPRTGMGLIGAAIIYSYLLMLILSVSLAVAGAGSFSMIETVKKIFDPDAVTLEHVESAHLEALAAAATIDTFIEENERFPESVDEAGIELKYGTKVKEMVIPPDSEDTLLVRLKAPDEKITLVLTRIAPTETEEGSWVCHGGPGVKAPVLPAGCEVADKASPGI